jgi:hypothetical protein
MFGSILVAILVFGCMFAATIIGLRNSNAAAQRVNASTPPSGHGHPHLGAPQRSPDMRLP